MFEEVLAKKVNDPDIEIWNSEWLNADMQAILKDQNIVAENVINEIDTVIKSKEVQLFGTKKDYKYEE